MSVIVKGMEMPNSCSNCELCACYTESKGEVYRCGITMTPVKHFEIRLEDCPLIDVPPHGRLIDADALLESIKEARKKDPEIEDVYIDDYFMVAEWVVSASTVIEAEGRS